MLQENLVSKIILHLGIEAEYDLAKTTETAKTKNEQRKMKTQGKKVNHEEKEQQHIRTNLGRENKRDRKKKKPQIFFVV